MTGQFANWHLCDAQVAVQFLAGHALKFHPPPLGRDCLPAERKFQCRYIARLTKAAAKRTECQFAAPETIHSPFEQF